MEKYLKDVDPVAFDSLYLDPNNPRLAPEDPPGYEDAKKLLDPKLQKEIEKRAEEESFGLDDLEAAIVGQGWMPIDAILIWEHPDAPKQHVVVEGNRRTAALRLRIRKRLPKEQKKLEKMHAAGKRYSKRDITEQERLVATLERVVKDTEKLRVLRINAESPQELAERLPRVLAVRHITGAKDWGNNAEDQWLLQRYQDLFARKHPGDDLRWEQDVVAEVANEASLPPIKTKRKLRASSCFSHFRRDFEDRLPKGEEFGSTDYYLFELVVGRRFPREEFGLGENDMHLDSAIEKVLFDWVFKKPRGSTAEDNPNIFYRHENIVVWDQMKRYDDNNNTSFAARFDVDDHENVPTMRSVEADYLAHKARRAPATVLESLLGQLDGITAATMREEGDFLRKQLELLSQRTEKLLAMVEAAEAKA